jgi:hypothetical protein
VLLLPTPVPTIGPLITVDPFVAIASAISVGILLTILGRAVLAFLRDWDEYREDRRKR